MSNKLTQILYRILQDPTFNPTPITNPDFIAVLWGWYTFIVELVLYGAVLTIGIAGAIYVYGPTIAVSVGSEQGFGGQGNAQAFQIRVTAHKLIQGAIVGTLIVLLAPYIVLQTSNMLRGS